MNEVYMNAVLAPKQADSSIPAQVAQCLQANSRKFWLCFSYFLWADFKLGGGASIWTLLFIY